MLNFLIRGIPNFMHVEQYTELALIDMLSRLTLRVSHDCKGDIKADLYSHFYGLNNPKRVILYMQRTSDNKQLIEQYCTEKQYKTLQYNVITITDKNTIKCAGCCGSLYDGDIGAYYKVNPALHSDYARLLEKAIIARTAQNQARIAAQELEEALEVELHRLIDEIGVTEALKRLKG